MKKLSLLYVLLLIATFLSAQSRWSFGPELAIGIAGHNDRDLSTYTNAFSGTTTIDFSVIYQPIMHVGGWAEFKLGERYSLRSGTLLRYMQFKNFSEITSTMLVSPTTTVEETISTHELELAMPLQLRRYSLMNDNGNRWWLGAGFELEYLLMQRRSLQSAFTDGAGNQGYYEADFTSQSFLLSRWRGMAQGEIGWQRGRAQLSILAAFAFMNANRYAAQPFDCLNCDFVGGGGFLVPGVPGLGLVFESPGIRSRRWRSLSLRLGYDLTN